MLMPALSDTIVAVSTGWEPTAIGIVRLSGPDTLNLVSRLGVLPPEGECPRSTAGRLRLDADTTLPVTVLWFSAPRSYTGQDLVELHTVGCLPLLRELSARLIALGARRALPGEFTARAFLAGRLDVRQVEGVLALMGSEHEAAVRQAARLARDSARSRLSAIVERITRLLARIEAGIDFVEEEDVRLVSPPEVVQTLDELLEDLGTSDLAEVPQLHGRRPHIALVGLPNAGKSTLFNALLGHHRALVSPVPGTTRDVLSAQVELAGRAVVLQDCAGLGASQDELELATHLATEQAAQQADLVLWVHACDRVWEDRETGACARVPLARRILVHSKMDLSSGGPLPDLPVAFADAVQVSAASGTGVDRLRNVLTAVIESLPSADCDARRSGELQAAAAALQRARDLAAASALVLSLPELLALELRVAHDLLAGQTPGALVERLLDRVFTQFCVGK
jgi:tRNA modification GTPase